MDKNINLKNKIIYPFIGLIFPVAFLAPSNVVAACITSDNFFV